MSKHTPGPWVKHTPSNATQTALIARELPNHRRSIVAVIPDHLQHGNAAVTDWFEMEANARLVAAAPELLEALRNLLAEGEFADYPNTRQWHAVQAARAAITKATGEQA